MQNNSWLPFLSSKIRSQILTENVHKAQTWGLGLLALISFGLAVNGIVGDAGRSFIFVNKVLFISLWNLILIAVIYMPGVLQKGEKNFSRFLGIRDFTSLVFIHLALTLTSLIVTILSFQITTELANLRSSALFNLTAWANFVTALFYLGTFFFYFASLAFYPKALSKLMERAEKAGGFFLGLHSALFIGLLFSYSELIEIGSGTFFDQLRICGLFWISIVSAVLFLGHFLQGSSGAALSALELEVVSGRLDRPEDILTRYKEAFILRRLFFWINRISHSTATKAHEVARYLHEAVTFVAESKPSESQIAQIEDRYRRANAIYRQLEKQHQRFLLNISFFNLLEIEREKIEELKDLFSKELRHAKLELSSVRKRIDDKLVSMKEGEKGLPAVPAPRAIEELPLPR